MKPLFSAVALTLFPEMFPGPLGCSLAGRALKEGLWSLETMNIRDFATDRHKTVDDSPYGGGAGMVMKPDVLDAAIEAAKTRLPEAKIIYPSPRGIPLANSLVEQLKSMNLIIVCGRFEGVDERIVEHHDMLEVSLGDFVLSGGEIAALAMLDAIVRLLPGVIGNTEATHEESFAETPEFSGLLEYPHYTRPPIWKGRPVPDVLLSGNHEQIRAWRLLQAERVTAARRPELIKKEIRK
ncbi:MAG: tRNA (guanosine(37)-N1)-methyltransferase TrmD [Pseudomonadota bacterium]|nr:tRNA (guanosine(37)-N1)-methyltransferase TrmD [Pseudomonadota bacterium]MDE3037724.1 tRNA (guanosine(37)-N1)-methyltransferase TrmD [Pseudomonadota bacterium]